MRLFSDDISIAICFTAAVQLRVHCEVSVSLRELEILVQWRLFTTCICYHGGREMTSQVMISPGSHAHT